MTEYRIVLPGKDKAYDVYVDGKKGDLGIRRGNLFMVMNIIPLAESFYTNYKSLVGNGASGLEFKIIVPEKKSK